LVVDQENKVLLKFIDAQENDILKKLQTVHQYQ